MIARFSVVFPVMTALCMCAAGCSGTNVQSDPEDRAAGVEAHLEFGYEMYNELLKTYVDDAGLVDYAGLKQNRAELDRFVASLGTVPASKLESWDVDAQTAFWINAYNAITLQYIVDHHPIQKGGLISGALYPANSIRQISGVWDELTRPVAGTPITLNDIEHEILRKRFSEPRIHVAIVCASIGCPPLRNEAFEAERLEAQLEDQSRQFIGHPDRFRIDRAKSIVYLSPIFEWFGKDFAPTYTPESGFEGHNAETTAVLAFVAAHVSDSDAGYLRNERYSVKFSDYDWSLNEQ